MALALEAAPADTNRAVRGAAVAELLSQGKKVLNGDRG
jgi:hypothetical protein